MLSDFATKELVPFVLGDNCEGAIHRKGSELVSFFNQYGLRDVYDFNQGGLPKLRTEQEQNTSRKAYTADRLKQVAQNDAQITKLLSDLINTATNPQCFADRVEKIIKPDGFMVVMLEGKYVVNNGFIIKDSPIINDVTFEDNKNKILATLDRARVSILVAMAWFTENAFAEKLKEKQAQGVEVRIVIYDDGVNANHGANLEGLDVKAIRGTRGGIMHNKFCVTDNQIVINGSYNWSKQAETKNDETVMVLEDIESATKCSVEFRRLSNRKSF